MRQIALLAGSLAALALACGSVGAKAAVFGVGGTAVFQYYSYGGAYDNTGSPTTIATPGSATFLDYFTVTLSGDQIVYTYLSDVTWSPSVTSLDSGGLYIDNGSLISSVSGIPAFTSVKLDPSSMLGSSGFTSKDVTWNSSNVAVTWMNLPFVAGNTVVLDVNSIPEPSTWAMMLIGFAGLGFAGYRTSRKGVSVAA
jgi:PEP-CTERM motif